ncbi:DUF5067 domain-containing protein [Salicibibacter cibi]|uniref:DUF5067 domain-containing protein n=1 Tax=Salicibibacter cibi TaxID=2743001 RepID=A0A7T7CE37_9BACI|nr:DUF5067 domain-containing protein [Salicibibacter cibi]QQK78664.1 DUF5067 domain-containing protein [Salicibibacter cibi]
MSEATANTTMPEKNSMATAALVLGIVGLVIGFIPFLGWFMFPAWVMAIIFGIIGRKQMFKKTSATVGMILGIITIIYKFGFWILIAMLPTDEEPDFASDEDNESEESESEEEMDDVTEEVDAGATEEEEQDTEEGVNEENIEEADDENAEIVIGESMEIDDYTLTVQDYTLSTDHDGDDVLVIEYDWVNNSDENASPFMTFIFTGYQDGVETDSEGIVEDVDLETGQNDVQPGGEVEGAETTVGINDMDEELELELDVLLSFDSDPYTTTIDLEDLE